MIFLYLLCYLLTSIFNVSSFDQDLLCSQKKTKMLSNCIAVSHDMSLFNKDIHLIKINDKKSLSKEVALQTVQSFIEKGADVNSILPNGYTVLYEAVKNGNQAIVEALIQSGAEVNAVLPLGQSVLHIAVQSRNLEIVKTLIESDAYLIRDKRGLTPKSYARGMHDQEVLDYLTKVELIFYKKWLNAVFDLDWDSMAFLGEKLGDYSAFADVAFVFVKIFQLDERQHRPCSSSVNGCELEATFQSKNTKFFLNNNPSVTKRVDKILVGMRSCKFDDLPSDFFSRIPAVALPNFFIKPSKEDKEILSSFYPQYKDSSHNYLFQIMNSCIKEKSKFIDSWRTLNSIKHVWERKTRQIKKHIKNIIKGFDSKNEVEQIKLILEEGVNPNIDTLLHFACQSNNLEVVQLLVQHGAWVDRLPNESNESRMFKDKNPQETKEFDRLRFPIHIATTYGSKEIVKYLVGQGVNIDVKDSKGFTALDYAVQSGCEDIVNILQKKQKIVNILQKKQKDKKCDLLPRRSVLLQNNLKYETSRGYTNPFETVDFPIQSCRQDEQKILSMIKSYSFAETNGKKTPLGLAIESMRPDIVKFLLKYFNLNEKSNNGMGALHAAARYGDIESVRLLLEKGVEVNVRNETYDMTPLHCAVRGGHVEIVKLLIEKGADLNARDKKNKMTPLHYACQESNSKIVALFVEKDDILVNIQDKYGVTPIMISLFKKDYPSIELLLQWKHDVTLRDCLGYSLLHYNSLMGNPVVIGNIGRYFEDLGPAIRCQGFLGHTPLDIAASCQYEDLVKKLVDFGADCNERNKDATKYSTCREDILLERGLTVRDVFLCSCPYSKMFSTFKDLPCYGYTSLHIACMQPNDELALYLMGKSDIDARDLRKETPLHHACRKGQFLTVLNLISKGANVNVTNSVGSTPLHVLAEALSDPILAERLSLPVGSDFERISNEAGRIPFDEDQHTLLYYIIQVFIENGYDTSVCDINEENAFDNINKMISSPYIMNKFNYIQRDQIREILLSQKDRNSKNYSINTRLYYACKEGNFLMVLDLLNKGAKIDLTMSKGQTLLHCVCQSFGAKKVSTFIKELTENQGGVLSKDEKKISDFFIAQIIERNRPKGKISIDQDDRSLLQYMIQTLIDANVDVGLLDAERKTTMHYVCETFREDLRQKETQPNKPHFSEIEKKKILDIFLETKTWNVAQFDKNYSNFFSGEIKSNFVFKKRKTVDREDLRKKDEKSDATIASMEMYQNFSHFIKINNKNNLSKEVALQTLQSFIDKGVDVNSVCPNGYTVLYEAVKNGNQAIVEALIQLGAEVNAVLPLGQSVLHIATQSGHLEIVKTLIESDAYLTRDFLGKTPQSYAREMHYEEVLDYLTKAELIFYKKWLDAVFDLNWDSMAFLGAKLGNYSVLANVAFVLVTIFELDKRKYRLCFYSVKGHKLEATFQSKNRKFILDNHLPRDFFSRIPAVALQKFLINTSEEDKEILSSLYPQHKDSSHNYLFQIMNSFIKENSSSVDIIRRLKDIKSEWELGTKEIKEHINNIIKEVDSKNEVEQIKLILEKGVNPNMDTLLHFACQSNNLEVVQLLVQHGAWLDRLPNESKLSKDKNLQEEFDSLRFPIHIATIGKSKEIVEYLVSQGVNIHRKDSQRMTVLHLATQSNFIDLVKFFVQETSLDIDAKDSQGCTALDYAVQLGYQNIVNILLARQRDTWKDWLRELSIFLQNKSNDRTEIAHKDSFKAVDVPILKKICININWESKSGMGALHDAVRDGNIDSVRLLIEQGADVNVRDKKDNMTLLHYAVRCGHVDIVRLLIEQGADVNVHDKQYHMTPLHYACQESNSKMVELFVERDGSLVNIQDKYGVTPIMIALFTKNHAVLDLLLQWPQSINISDRLGHSLLHYNACLGNTDVVGNINEYAEDMSYYVNSPNFLDINPLQLAVVHQFYSLVKMLVELGADCKKRNESSSYYDICREDQMVKGMTSPSCPYFEMVKACRNIPCNGYTPLHLACMNKSYTIALYLMAKSDIHARDFVNKTPLHHACKHGQFLTALNLISRGADVNAIDSDGNTPLHYFERLLSNSDELSIPVASYIGKLINIDKKYKQSLPQNLPKRGLFDDKENRVSDPDNLDDIIQDLKYQDEKAGRIPFDENQQPLLHYMIQVFIDNGYNTFARNKSKNTSFDLINKKIISDREYDFNFIQKDQIRELLLSQQEMPSKNESINTRLYYACKEGDFLRVLDLLNKGAKIDLTMSKGETALHCVCQSFGAKKVSTFIKELTENKEGFLSKDEKKISDSLIAQIIKRNRQERKPSIDQDDRSLLHYMIQKLIDENVDVVGLDNQRNTAMHYLCKAFREDLSKKAIQPNKPHFSEIEKNKILDIFLKTETLDTVQFQTNRSNFLSGNIQYSFVFEKQKTVDKQLDATIALMEMYNYDDDDMDIDDKHCGASA